jgi:Ca2+-binding EF-hand superfamily protein
MRQGFVFAAVMALCLSPGAWAEEGERSEGASRSLIRELIEKFDLDGDGKLTGEEREAARKALAERRERGGRDGERPRSEADGPRREADSPHGEGDKPSGEGDKPRGEGDKPRGEGDKPRGEGDGPRGEGDKLRAEGDGPSGDRPPTREEILAKFDEDGNGKLEGAELVKAQAEAKRRREAERERENASRPEQSGIRLTVDQQRTLLREFDKNRDGKLTGEERERAMRFAREKWGGGGAERREGDRREGGENRRPGGGDRPR